MFSELGDEPQPIATAPREPTLNLLLFDEDWYIGWWHMKHGWMTVSSSPNDAVKRINPTHWLPLPPNPA